MILQQINLKNYFTHKECFKEVTPGQHKALLKKIAEEGQHIEIQLIKEREL